MTREAAADDNRGSVAPGIFEALWRFRFRSILIVLVAAALAVGGTMLVQTSRTVQAKMALTTPEKDNVIVGVSVTNEPTFLRYVKQRALYATSDRVLTTASRELGGDVTAASLRTQVTAKSAEAGDAVIVVVTDSSIDQAVIIANAVVAAYQTETRKDVSAAVKTALDAIAVTRTQLVKDQAAGGAKANAANTALAQLDIQANNVRVSAAQFGSGVSFVAPATADTAKGGEPPLREGAVGLALGILLAAALAWLWADRDRRVRDAETLAAVTGLPSLGEIARTSGGHVSALTDMPSAGYEIVAATVQSVVPSGVVLVTGAGTGEGGTTTAAQLAVAAARDGSRVLLVDAVPARPRLSELFEVGSVPRGLATVAAQQAVLDECTYCVEIADTVRLWILPAGGAGIAVGEPLPSAPLTKAIVEMRTKYDLVVVDAAPVADSPDAAVFTRNGDGAVAVVARGQSERAVRRMVRQLETYGATIYGTVFTFAAKR